jgi:membrane protease YdiL (CAAX protease family)
MLNILFISTFLGLAIGSIPLWINAIARKRSSGALMATRSASPSPLGFIDIIVMFFFWFVGQVTSIGAAIFFLGLDPGNLLDVEGSDLAWLMILIALGQLLATFLGMCVLLARYRRLSVFGWQPENLKQDLVIGGLAFMLVVPSILMVQWLLTQIVDYQHSTLEMLTKNADALTISAAWLGAVLVAPICEEIFFRGVLQGWLQRLGKGRFFSDQVLTGGWDPVALESTGPGPGAKGRGESDSVDFQALPPGRELDPAMPTTDPNPYAAPRTFENLAPAIPGTGDDAVSISFWPVVVSAAIFGLAHIGQGPAPIPLFLFGLALGYVYRKTGSIMPCIVLHMLLNGFSMFWFTLQVLFNGEPPEAPMEVAQLVDCFIQCVSNF